MKSSPAAGLLVLLIALAVGGLVYYTFALPWLGDPKLSRAEITARWQSLRSEAGFVPPPQGDPSNLIKAEVALENQREAIAAVLSRVGTGPLTVRDLPESGRIAARALALWVEGGASLGSSLCGDGLDAMPQFTLGRLMVGLAGRESDAPELRAVLALARALRSSGDLDLVSVGFNLPELAAQSVEARGLRAGPVFAEMRPQVSEIYTAFLRGAVCDYEAAEHVLLTEGMVGLTSGQPSEVAGPFLLRPYQQPARELLVFQAYEIQRMAAAAKVRDDLAGLRRVLRVPSRSSLPASPAVRAFVRDPDEAFERWREVLANYDAFLVRHKLAKPSRP